MPSKSITPRDSQQMARAIANLPQATALLYADSLVTQQDCAEALGFETMLNNRSAVQDALRKRSTCLREQGKSH